MKFFFFLLFSLTSLAGTRVTTLNLKWFGVGGELSGKFSDEYRSPWLKEFLKEYLTSTELFIFQEVVDLELLGTLMKQLDFNCHSYSNKSSKHQYVVICLKSTLAIVPEAGDDNIVFEEVASVDNSKLRPAISGVVINSQTKSPLFHVLGVHLKAGKFESELRIKQVKLLAQRVSEFKDKIPTILLGDFNSYSIKENEFQIDDLASFDSILNNVNLSRVNHHFRFSFKSFNYGYLFDHIYLSSNLEFSNIDIFSACNQSFSNSTRYKNISFYNRFISDHCPVSIDIQ